MNRPFLLLVIFVQICCVLIAGGRDFPMLHFTVENGLPSNNVYYVCHDSKGFIWLSTDKGVARFNGVKFEIFSTYNGLPDNEIFFLQEDHYGRMWFGSFSGELSYYKDGVIHTAANTPFLNLHFKAAHMKHISVEYDSSLILNFFDKSKFVIIDKERSKVYYLDSVHGSDVSESVTFVKKLPQNRFKLICSDKVVIIDTSYRIIDIKSLDKKYQTSRHFFAVSGEREFLYNDHYFFPVDMGQVYPIQVDINSVELHEIYNDGGKVFYSTNKGLQIDTMHLLNESNVSSVIQDGHGNYWISTLNNGIFVLDNDFFRSGLYQDAYEGKVKYSYAYDGHIFFVTASNKLYDLSEGKIVVRHVYENRRQAANYPIEFGFAIDSSYRYFNFYGDDFTFVDNILSPRLIRRKVYPVSGAKAICVSGDDLYFRLPQVINHVHYPQLDKANSIFVRNGNNSERIFWMAKAPDNSIWYTTINNTFRITNADTDGVAQPQFGNINLKYFVFYGPYLMGYTHNNMLLICRGYNTNKVVVDSISQRDCIWDRIFQIDSVHFILSTNNLYRLLTIVRSGSKESFLVHAIENEFIPPRAETICSDGMNCYFFKNNSITIFNRDIVFDRPASPTVMFTNLKTDKTVYPVREDIELAYNDARQVSLSFSILSLAASNVTCEYSLSTDANDKWRVTKGDEINFNPGFGRYYIKLRAKSRSSEWSKPVLLTLHVLNPYWATWWFISLAILVLTLVIGAVLRIRILTVIRKKQKVHDNEVKFIRSEFKALNALMNPHFIFNTLNNVQGLVNRNDKLAANEYIRVFADLIRQNMSNISRELIPLQKEIDLVSNYLLLEKLRFKEHLNYTIDIDSGVELSDILVPPLLVQPIVENSIKHGILPLQSGEGFIRVHVFEDNGKICIQVTDNGVGLQANVIAKSMHESFGLHNLEQRVRQLSLLQEKNISFSISTEKDNEGKVLGTKATISIEQ